MNLQEFRDSVLTDQPPADLNFALSGCGGMLRAIGPELTNRHSKTRVRLVHGYMHTYTVRKAIRRTLHIGISVPANIRAAVRSRTSGLQLRMRCFADPAMRLLRVHVVELWPSNYH
jgi:hypothetical protein